MGVTWVTEIVRSKHDIQSTEKKLEFRESSFNMTRGGGKKMILKLEA